MIIKHTKHTINILRSITTCTPSLQNTLLSTPAYPFSSSTWNKDKVLNKINKEIIDSQTAILNKDKDEDAYFRTLHWKIRFDQQRNLFIYGKIQNDYDVQILTPVKHDPPNCADKEPKVSEKQQNKFNYSHLGIFIRKKGESKWLTAEMLVVQGSVQLLGIFFTQGEPGLNWQKSVYPGPQISSLPEGIIGSVNEMLMKVGLSTEVLMNMVIFSSSKIEQLDLKWLKNLHSLWN